MDSNKPPKTFWNYRVILDKDKNGHPFYSIRGVHYAKHGQKIEGWDAEPTNLIFEQGDSITEWLRSVEAAVEKPVLMVQGDTLTDLGERPAEMFVSQWGEYPKCINNDTIKALQDNK